MDLLSPLTDGARALWSDPQLQWLLSPLWHLPAHSGKLLLAALLSFLLLLYYLIYHVRRPHLYYLHTALNEALVARWPRLHRAYWPTPYLTHEVAQAAVGSFVRFDPRIKRDPKFQREIRRMADGELLALDWLMPLDDSAPEDAPIVFTCHGLAGHSDELNMQFLALEVRATGARFAIMNRRGCAHDMVLQGEKIYLWGCTSDMREVLAHIKRRYPRAPIFGIGFSAGSNLLTKYLGETGSASLIDAGLSVANGFDLKGTSEALHSKPFYAGIMVNILLNLLERNEATFKRIEHLHRHEDALLDQSESATAAAAAAADVAAAADADADGAAADCPAPQCVTARRRHKLNLSKVRQIRSVRDWDEHFSLPVHAGFESLEDFYAAQSTTPELVRRIAVPLMNIHATDDPIIPAHVVPMAALHANPRVIVATTSRGGHLGFTEGLWPFNKPTWIEKLSAEWAAILARPDMLAMVRQAREEARAEEQEREQEQEAAAAAAAAAAVATEGEQGASQQSEVDTEAPTRHVSSHSRSHSRNNSNSHSHGHIVHGHSHSHAHAHVPAPLSFHTHAHAHSSSPSLRPLHGAFFSELPAPVSYQLSPDSAASPTEHGQGAEFMDLEEDEQSEQQQQSQQSSAMPDASPLLPPTPEAQPHTSFSHFPAAAAATHDHGAEQMEFSFGEPSPPPSPVIVPVAVTVAATRAPKRPSVSPSPARIIEKKRRLDDRAEALAVAAEEEAAFEERKAEPVITAPTMRARSRSKSSTPIKRMQ